MAAATPIRPAGRPAQGGGGSPPGNGDFSIAGTSSDGGTGEEPGAPPPPVARAERLAFATDRPGAAALSGTRLVPEETPVALVYNGGTYAVMMATPANLEDFAIGFSLTERIIASPADITRLSIADHPDGIEVQIWLASSLAEPLARRRRAIAGPVGCGLCGVDSLAEAARPVARVTSAIRFAPAQILAAMHALSGAQPLHEVTRAIHAAGFWTPAEGLVAAREDVGRHNALDKLIGALAQQGRNCADGILLLTSRVSIELIQKASLAQAPVIAAVSAPTALAIRMAEDAGITLAAIVRRDGFELFTQPQRIAAPAHDLALHD